MKAFWFCLVLFTGLPSNTILAQEEKKPKIALVLSGGGAKGIAHIPLLQTLDSLGIVPDLIVGTSMGSVVGGFYAAGYTGDSIATIAKSANWNQLLGGKTLLKDVSVEEKSEYGRYLIDFGIKNRKLKTKGALLNDQHLREFLAIYTYPVYDVLNFNKLPIPFKSVTTDIVNGDEVVLDKGSLAVAMRASMSIPSIFKPVPYKDVLLVDGGILNNFPVDIAKEWGADIIIGSDVGGGMQPKEELEGISTILFQAAMLVSNKKNPKSREMCDILIDHIPNLTYSTGDFNKNEEIYAEGKKGTTAQLEALIDLSEKMKRYKTRKIKIPLTNKEFKFDTIIFKGINKNNLNFVKSRSEIKANKVYTINKLIAGVDRAMGTTLFNQITTKTIKKNGELGLEIRGYENAEHQLRTALHYDNYRGIGILLNYTGRNVLGKSSRIVLTGDIAAQPRFRAQYQKQFGKDKSWWIRNDLLMEFLNQDVYSQGEFFGAFDVSFSHFDVSFNKNTNSLNNYVGIGLNYEGSSLKPKSSFDDNILKLKNYRFHNYEINVHYVHNSMQKIFYSKEGTLFKAKLARSLYNEFDYESTAIELNTIRNKSINGFTKFIMSYQKRFPMHKKLSLIVNGNTNFIFQDKQKANEESFDDYGTAVQYLLGGNTPTPRDGSIIFPGLYENDLPVNQLIKVDATLQFNPMTDIYISPHVNYASVGFGKFNDFIKEAFLPSGNWSDRSAPSSVFSFGTTASYDSVLGPINFDISWVNDINKVRTYLGIGLFFNLSD